MGFWAARKALAVVENAINVLAVETLAALQGLHLLEPLEPSLPLRPILREARKTFPPLDGDRFFQPEIESMARWIREGRLSAIVDR